MGGADAARRSGGLRPYRRGGADHRPGSGGGAGLPHAAGDGAAAGHAHVRADGVHPVRRLHLLRDAVQLHGGRDGGHGRPVPPGVVKMAQKKEARRPHLHKYKLWHKGG